MACDRQMAHRYEVWRTERDGSVGEEIDTDQLLCAFGYLSRQSLRKRPWCVAGSGPIVRFLSRNRPLGGADQ